MSERPLVWLTPEAFSRPVGGVRRYALELEAAVSTFADVERLGPRVGTALKPIVGRRAATGIARSWADLRGVGKRGSDRAIVHSCYYDCSSLGRKNPLFVTVHDCIHERFLPGLRTAVLSRDKRKSIERAEMVLSISHSTQADLVTFYNLDEERSVVVYPPVSEMFTRGVDFDPERSTPSPPYLLHVGARGGYKNFPLLLESFAEFRRKRPEFNLVAVGGGSFTKNEGVVIHSLGLDERFVRHVGYAPDAELVTLYQNAAAVVCPSDFEGFGYPAAEALCVGGNVIVSDGGSMAEFAQFGAACFSAGSKEGLVEALRSITDNCDLVRQHRSEAIKMFERKRFISQVGAAYAQSN